MKLELTAQGETMEELKDKVETSTTAVEEGQKATPDLNGGLKETQPITKNEETQPFKVFKTQVDFDNEAAKIKGSVERNLMKKLGVKDEAEFEKMKSAYEASLTQEEKNLKALAELEEIKKSNTDKDFIIKALAKNSNEAFEDVEKQVIMAKSLLSAGTYQSFDEAFSYVRGLKVVQQEVQTPLQGKKIVQPDTDNKTIQNPFIKGENYNLKAQTELFRKDPELARKLAKEAGSIL